MISKKGQTGSSTTVYWIIAALVIVLAVVGILWASGYGDRIRSYIGGTNLDSVKQGCEAACVANNVYDFCSEQRSVKTKDKILCVGNNKLVEKAATAGTCTTSGATAKTRAKATCEELAASGVGIATDCPAIMPCS